MGKEQSQNTREAAEARDFHVYFEHGTADWLRSKKNRDAPTVPAVIRKIVEEAERQDKQRRRG